MNEPSIRPTMEAPERRRNGRICAMRGRDTKRTSWPDLAVIATNDRDSRATLCLLHQRLGHQTIRTRETGLLACRHSFSMRSLETPGYSTIWRTQAGEARLERTGKPLNPNGNITS